MTPPADYRPPALIHQDAPSGSIKPVGSLVEIGFSFVAVPEVEFRELMYNARVREKKHVAMRVINRGQRTIGCVYMVGDEPIAFYGADRQHYIRKV